MLTNNKKSYFAKGIAVLMALLMVLSVCLTGCGKAAEEAANNAQTSADAANTKAEDANTKAEEAKTAADAVKAELAKYLTTADGATKAEVNKLIEDALAPYAKSENVAADLAKFVKSEDFDNLVASLETYVTKAALTEALKDVATDAEVKKLTDDLAAAVAANKGNIDKALNDLKAVATDAEVAAIKKALEDKIAAGDQLVNDALAGYVTNAAMNAIQAELLNKIAAGDKAASDALKEVATDAEVAAIKKALEDKIAAGDKLVSDALAGYVTTADMNAIQASLQNKINAADQAAADVAESLKNYVKADEYALLVSSVQEATYKLMTIDREHYSMVMETLAPYIADQEALAGAVQYLTDEIAMLDKKHADYVNEILAGYTTSADFELLTGAVATLDEKLWDLQMNAKEQIAGLTNELDLVEARVQALDAQLTELHMNAKEQISNLINEDALLTARVQALDAQLTELHMNAKEQIAGLTNELDLVEARVQALDAQLTELHMNVKENLAALDAALTERIDGAFDAIQVLDGKLEELKNMAKGEVAANTNAINDALAQIAKLASTQENMKSYVDDMLSQLSKDSYDVHKALDALNEKANELQGAIDNNWKKTEALVKESIELSAKDAAAKYATKVEVEAIMADVKDLEDADEVLAGRLDKLEEVVRAILAAFYGEEEEETFDDGVLKDMLDMPAEAITSLIKDKMSLTEWNKTTPEVIETIEVVQTLMAKLYATEATDGKLTYAYTKAAKDLINGYLAALNIVVYDEDYELVEYEESAHRIEYTLLRVATLAELNELKEAIANACAVPSFSDELDALWNASLYTIGHTHKVSDTLTVQTVTIENKAEINAFVDAYDNLIVKYLLDDAYAGTQYDDTYALQKTYNVFEKDGVKKIADLDEYYEELDDEGDPIYWTKVDVTILVEDATGTDYATSQMNGVEFQKKDDYGLFYLPQDITEYNWANGTTTTSAVAGHYGNQELTVANYENNEGTYKALIAQTKDAQDKVNAANTAMDNFLSTVVKAEGIIAGANGTNIALKDIDEDELTDAQYDALCLEALTVGMCTYTVTEEPDGVNTKYAMYLLEEVQAAVSTALARNTCDNAKDTARQHSSTLKTAITKYDLYFQMYDKAWELTFDLFQSYARTMIAEILADYISVVDYIKANGADYTKTTDFYALDVNKKLSSDFLPAFLSGATFSGWTSKTSGNYNAILIENDFTATALTTYEVLNGTAKDATGAAIEAAPAATIAKYSEQLRMYLTSASLYAMAEINGATVEAAKAENPNQVNALFVKALNTMVDGLDEVFNRFLFEDYKKVQINAVYAYATEQADFYSYDGELAKDALIEAMEHYLTGYSATASTAATGTANKLFPAVTKLENASLTTDMATITVEMFAKIDGTTPVALTATAKKTDVDTLAASFKEDLINMAIKTYFQTYLDEATQNIARAYLDYMSAQNANGSFVLTYDMINRLVARRNYADTEISVKKFQDLMGNIAFDDYKTEYANVLKLISGKKQMEHLAALTDYTFDALTSTTEADVTMGLKSALTNLSYLDTALNNVVRPMDVLGTGTQAYNYVGMTIRYFDEIVNVNTKYWVTPATGSNYLVNLY